jgi:ribonuclease HI
LTADTVEGRLVLYFDGACRGNPGPASYGVYSPSGIRICRTLGRTTNNVAEWQGLIAALRAARDAGAKDVEIRADSLLVVCQFTGKYRMKAEHLRPLLEEARSLAGAIPRLKVRHVPREANGEADALANAALDGNESG